MTTQNDKPLTTVTVNDDICPKHSHSVTKKTYTFGIYQDVEVITYDNCPCATVWVMEGFNDDGIWYPSYDEAAGRAKMIVQQHSVW